MAANRAASRGTLGRGAKWHWGRVSNQAPPANRQVVAISSTSIDQTGRYGSSHVTSTASTAARAPHAIEASHGRGA